MRHVDHRRRGYGVQLSVIQHGTGAADRIYHVAGSFEGGDKIRRIAHLSGDNDAGRVFLPQAVAPEIGVVGGNGAETVLASAFFRQRRMVDVLNRIFLCRGRLRGTEALSVYIAADE